MWPVTWLSNLRVKALTPCFLLTEICLARSLRNTDKSASHLYTLLQPPVPVWVYCLHAHYLRPALPLALCSTPCPEVEIKEVSCRAFPGEGCFSLDHAPWSHTLITHVDVRTFGSQRANAQRKNHQSAQISLQGRDILEHNARSLSLCSLVEAVFRIH